MNNVQYDTIICPFLGLVDDPHTAISYPSPKNCCTHARPVMPINRAHQEHLCLSKNFKTCPIKLKEHLEPLPKEFCAGHSDQKTNRGLWLGGAVVMGAFLIALFTGILHIKPLDTLFTVQGQYISPLSTSIATEPLFLPLDPTPTPTHTPILPTQTVTPTSTAIGPTKKVSPTRTATRPTQTVTQTQTTIVLVPTDIPMHQLDTPFGDAPRFVIHRVIAGENFYRLSEKFNTSQEAIVAINYQMKPGLWANTIIVIPVGMRDVSGLPSFSLYLVAESGMTVEELARKESVDIALLLKYNALPGGYV
jgi:LysM repeat protein